MKKYFYLLLVLSLLNLGLTSVAWGAYYYRPQKEVVATDGLVASCDDRATEAGLQVLKKGGNAIDAALTIAFLMAVYEPYNSGLGGHGGHMAIYWAKTGDYLSIDASTRCPVRSKPDMFLADITKRPAGHAADAEQFRVKDDATWTGYRAMFAPSTVAGYWYLWKNYATIPWKELMGPAIKVAEEGFIADELYANSVKENADRLRKFQGSLEMYLPGGQLPRAGDRIVFKDLANTLRKIAEGGRDVFYKGEIADNIVEYVQKNGGVLSKEDFINYEVEVTPLLPTHYKGHTILLYPQSSNGAIISEVLNILAQFDRRKMGFNSVEATHVFIEALKLGFIDRYEYGGDRDFSPVPYDGMMSWAYGRERARLIDMKKAQLFTPGDPWKYQASGSKLPEKSKQKQSFLPKSANSQAQMAYRTNGDTDTTFLCAADRQGNLLLLTTSLSGSFGSAVTVPGLGITLNNTMRTMVPVPGHPLSIGPSKRGMRNSGPAIVVKDNKPHMLLSAPGGRKIITSMLQTLTNVIDYGMGIQAAIDAPRIHHEANLYEVIMEDRVPEVVRRKLEEMGHKIVVAPAFDTGYASVQGIMIDPESGLMFGGSEPRTHGGARGF